MKIIVFGGSFNPVHLGHVAMAAEAALEFDYDTILLVPAWRAPHKPSPDEPGPEHRLAMLRIAASGDPRVVVDECEILRGGISYTINTIRDLGSRYPLEGKPGLLIGDDLLGDFSSWREPRALADLADLVCCHRSSVSALPFDYPHRYTSNPLFQVSSSVIRARAVAGLPFRHLVHPGVYAYIAEKGLYGYR
jgi:nicotinate-nucleotide adenylyltransferase